MNPTTLSPATVQFLAAAVLVAIVASRLGPTARRALIAICSYGYAALWSAQAITLLAGVTVSAYVCARLVAPEELAKSRLRARVAKDRLLVVGIAVSITAAPLVLLKIASVFFADAAVTKWFSSTGSFTPWSVSELLPVGLSFFTFSAVSYVIDVARGRQNTMSLLELTSSIGIFPILLAGPITRPLSISKDLEKGAILSSKTWSEAGELIVMGLVKKLVFADALGLVIAKASASLGVAPQLGGAGWATLAIIALVFLPRVVLDFSGYTDIARGVGILLGINLPRNFFQPLTTSRSYSEYWRKHHATIMGWLRDYVYTPIRGDSHALWRRNLGIFAVFTVSGLWHGPTLEYVTWGVLSAVLIITEEAAARISQAGKKLEAILLRVSAALVAIFGIGAISMGHQFRSTLSGLIQGCGFPAGAFEAWYLPTAIMGLGAIVLFDFHELGKLGTSKMGMRRDIFLGVLAALALVFINKPQPFFYVQF